MKTKIIPFDLETALKIQAGEIEGKMYVSDDTHNKIRLICTDRKSAFGKIVALEEDKIGVEWIVECNLNGEFLATMPSREQYSTTRCIVLEVLDNDVEEIHTGNICFLKHNEPKEPQFKPFDRVLVRGNDASLWKAGYYSHELDGKHCVCGDYYALCIPYEGNQELIGTCNEPKCK